MAQKCYIGLNNLAKEIKNIYVGVNGVARKVVKGYVGVNGIARQFYGLGPISAADFWFFYKTLADNLVECKYDNGTIYDVVAFNDFDGIVFYAFVSGGYSRNSYWYDCIVISTDPNALELKFTMNGGSPMWYDDGGDFVYNNETWYWEAAVIGKYDREAVYPGDFSPDCFIEGSSYYDPDLDIYDYEGFIRDVFLPKIYANDFVQEYIVNQTYNLVKADVEKTLRKAIAIWLYKNALHRTNAGYQSMLANVETLVSHFLSCLAKGLDYNRHIPFDVVLVQITHFSYGGSDEIDFDVLYSYNSSDNEIVTGSYQDGGYQHFTFNADSESQELPEYMDVIYIEGATLTNSVSYWSNDDPGVDPISTMGVLFNVDSSWYDVELSNLGLMY